MFHRVPLQVSKFRRVTTRSFGVEANADAPPDYAFRLSDVNLDLNFIRHCLHNLNTAADVCPAGCSAQLSRAVIGRTRLCPRGRLAHAPSRFVSSKRQTPIPLTWPLHAVQQGQSVEAVADRIARGVRGSGERPLVRRFLSRRYAPFRSCLGFETGRFTCRQASPKLEKTETDSARTRNRGHPQTDGALPWSQS